MLTRMTIAAGTLGVSLAFAGSALAAPSPLVRHGRPHTQQTVRHAVAATTTSGPKLYVNGDAGSDQGGANTCRLSSNPCATITHAVAIAPTTATIEVAGGTYHEQLSIVGKNLTINGDGSTRTIIDPTTLQTDNNDPNSAGPQAVIVEFQNTTSGGLSNLTVSGSGSGGSEPSDGSCDQDYVGVEFANASGLLSGDAVTGVQEQQSFFGCQQGLSVYVANDNGSATVKMKGLAVTKYQKDGIDCADMGTTCTISGSTVTGIGATDLTAQNGIETDSGVNASITGNTVTDNSYTSPTYASDGTYYTASGVLAYDSSTVTISGNTVNNNDENVVGYEDASYSGPAATWTIKTNTVTAGTNNTGPNGVPVGYGVGDGVDLWGVGETGGGQSNPVTTTVSGNTVTGNADWGIALFGASGATIGGTTTTQTNIASHNADDGIYLGEYSPGLPSTDNTVSKNTVNGNLDDGILADGPDSMGVQQATDNTFHANTMKNNTRYDAEDRSTGAGTAGTANTWTGDKCSPAQDSSPTGLCS